MILVLETTETTSADQEIAGTPFSLPGGPQTMVVHDSIVVAAQGIKTWKLQAQVDEISEDSDYGWADTEVEVDKSMACSFDSIRNLKYRVIAIGPAAADSNTKSRVYVSNAYLDN